MKDASSGESHDDGEQALECVVYLSGFAESLITTNQLCTQKTPSIESIVRMYVAYMDKHPKMFAEERAEGVLNAFRDAYPCSGKPKGTTQ